jgi:perosamine synthetase
VVEPGYARSNYWLNTLLLDKASLPLRDAILETTNEIGIQTRPVWNLISELPMYASCPRMPLNRAIDLEQRIVSLPSSPKLAH